MTEDKFGRKWEQRGTKLDDPTAEPGSLELADEKKEKYCSRVVTEPHVKPIDIFKDLYPEKVQKKLFYQIHNQYKNGKGVRTRLQWLKKKAFTKSTDAVDENYSQLVTLRDKLYQQAHNKSGDVIDTAILDRYFKVVDILNKMYGEYKHTQKHEVSVSDNVADAKEDVEKMLDEQLAKYRIKG